MNATTKRLVVAKPTWKMTATELARVVADHQGWEGRKGGWIYSATGLPVAHGWAALADVLVRRGWIEPGVGVHWLRIERSGLAR